MPVSAIRRIELETRRLERLGRLAARDASLEVQRRTIRAYRRGDVLRVADYIQDAMLELTVAAMSVSHLRGMIRSRQLHRAASVSLAFGDVFTEVLKVLQVQAGVGGLDELNLLYTSQATQVLGEVGLIAERELQATAITLVGQGAHVKLGVETLRGKFSSLGLAPRNDYQLETLFRAQTQIAYNAGRWQADQDPAVQEILWGYEYSTVGDDRVRATHAALDGIRLRKTDPFWDRFWPPNGWGCRCIVVPLFEEVAERPPKVLVEPDRAFDFNPGMVFGSAGQAV